MEPYDYCEYFQDRGAFVCVFFFFCLKLLDFIWVFYHFPLSFAFLSVCNESEGSTRQLEYLYSPVVEKVCYYLFID